MKQIFTAVILIISSINATAQISDVEEKFDLPSVLNESSGSIFFNDQLISHNDSGNQNKLYEVDTISGLVTRTVNISNATNVDWEDITQDDTSIYIGDIGNNSGNRTDLKIYKISKSDYLTTTDVSAEIINFSYSDQVDFTPQPNNTKWDAEALISINSNTLILLTKNWVNGTTKAYAIPKNSGNYSVNPLSSTLTNSGLITGASYNQSTDKLYLTGYNSVLQPFIWISENFTDIDVFSGSNTQIQLSSLGFEQIEAITHSESNRYFMTSESFDIQPVSDNAKLISFSTNDAVLSTQNHTANGLSIYPNPTKKLINIDGVRLLSVEIYDLNSRLILKSKSHKIDLSGLDKGIYMIKINLMNADYLIRKIIKI